MQLREIRSRRFYCGSPRLECYNNYLLIARPQRSDLCRTERLSSCYLDKYGPFGFLLCQWSLPGAPVSKNCGPGFCFLLFTVRLGDEFPELVGFNTIVTDTHKGSWHCWEWRHSSLHHYINKDNSYCMGLPTNIIQPGRYFLCSLPQQTSSEDCYCCIKAKYMAVMFW